MFGNVTPGYGTTVYSDDKRRAVEISLPHILRITVTPPPFPPPGPVYLQRVYLFQANRNYILNNYGNEPTVEVTYINTNPSVPFTYSDLLATTLTSPFQTGITRIHTNTLRQSSSNINITKDAGLGKISNFTINPLIFPDQYQDNIAYIERDYTIDQYTGLSYNQEAISNPSVYMYFYNFRDVNLLRAILNKPLVAEYLRPKTGLTRQFEFTGHVPSQVRSSWKNLLM